VSTEPEPGFPVTEDSPPVGSRVLGRCPDGWHEATRELDCFAISGFPFLFVQVDRWAPLPGESGVERALAHPRFGGISRARPGPGFVAWIWGGAQFIAPTAEAACAAALEALDEETQR